MPARAVRLLPEAQADLRGAEQWYWERSLDAADGFLQEVAYALSLIGEAPETWPLYRRGARRYVLRRYPFSVIYRLRGTVVYVVAIAHSKRRPDYWRNR